jgi:hypothetical protein
MLTNGDAKSALQVARLRSLDRSDETGGVKGKVEDPMKFRDYYGKRFPNLTDADRLATWAMTGDFSPFRACDSKYLRKRNVTELGYLERANRMDPDEDGSRVAQLLSEAMEDINEMVYFARLPVAVAQIKLGQLLRSVLMTMAVPVVKNWVDTASERDK